MTDIAPANETAARQDHSIEFRGSGSEYFRIWIVNLLLSIITLGIYSAWATVRNRRYLYGNTFLMESAFDYHADGMQVLKGRLLAVAALVGYIGIGHWAPTVQPLVVLIMLPLLPWVIVSARRFQLFQTSWRNIRFGFDGTYGEAARVFLLWPLLIPFTLGLIYPYIYFRQQGFFVDNSRFGRDAFKLGSGPGFFYGLTLGIGVVVVTAYLIVALLIVDSATGAEDASRVGLLSAGAFYGIALVAAIVFRTAVLNHVWSHAHLRDARFTLRIGIGRMLWIALSNLVLIIATAGLFTPWAKVRKLRYQLASMTVSVTDDDLHMIEASADAERSSAGDEVAGAFDLDVGIA